MVGNNGVPFVNGKLYDWADIVLVIAGVPVTGITGIEYKDDQDIVTKYGAGRYPVGYAKGRITSTGKITLYQEEVEAMQRQSLTGRLQDIAPFDIIVDEYEEDEIPADMIQTAIEMTEAYIVRASAEVKTSAHKLLAALRRAAELGKPIELFF